ncbi:MAG: hypothetical protein K2G31_04485 [Clostridia bacterium]|nr:hypothetical protein [Clostridia bacterium]
MNETTQTIINAVTIFLSSSVGATVLGAVFKTIINAVTSIKTKKYSKLTEADKDEIAERSANRLYLKIQGGIVVDMDAQIDKATARRITAVEKSQNEIIGKINELMMQQRVELTAIGDFKTISQSSKEQIQGILGTPASKLPVVTVIEQPMLQVAPIEQDSVDEKPKKHKVAY